MGKRGKKASTPWQHWKKKKKPGLDPLLRTTLLDRQPGGWTCKPDVSFEIGLLPVELFLEIGLQLVHIFLDFGLLLVELVFDLVLKVIVNENFSHILVDLLVQELLEGIYLVYGEGHL